MAELDVDQRCVGQELVGLHQRRFGLGQSAPGELGQAEAVVRLGGVLWVVAIRGELEGEVAAFYGRVDFASLDLQEGEVDQGSAVLGVEREDLAIGAERGLPSTLIIESDGTLEPLGRFIRLGRFGDGWAGEQDRRGRQEERPMGRDCCSDARQRAR